MTRNDSSRTVYCTEVGRVCPECVQPVSACVCKKNKPQPKGDGIIRIRTESKGRHGKTVTVVTGLLLDESGLQEITTRLKRLCGAGGAVKEGTIEIQGEHRETIMVELKKQGYKVK